MCGISAQVSFQAILQKESLLEMLKWVHPAFSKSSKAKCSETREFQNVFMGSCCEGAMFSDPGNTVWLVFCGTLYNKIPIQDIIKGYLESKEESFKKLDGEFSFILLDTNSQELFAVRDRMGIYPLYWHITAKYAYLSTSLKAILSTGSISPTPDLTGIAESLSLGFISQDVTSIEGINRLLPGYYLRLSLKGPFSIIPYWSFSSTFEKEYSSEFDTSRDIYCELERHIKTAILQIDGKKTAYLAGKAGSNIILDTLSEQGHVPNLIKIEPTPSDFLSSLIPMIWAMEMPNSEMSSLESWMYIQKCQQENLTCYFDTGFKAEFYDYSKEALELYQTHYPVHRHDFRTIWSKLAFYLIPRRHLRSLRKMQEATPQIAFLEKNLLLSDVEFERAAPELSRHFDATLFINQFYHLSRIPKLDASLFYLTIKSTVTDGLSESRMRFAQSHDVRALSPFLDYKLLEFFASISPEVWASPDLIAAFPEFWKENHPSQNNAPLSTSQTNLEELLLSKDVWPWLAGLEKGMLVDTGLINSHWVKMALSTPKKHLQALFAMLVLEIWMKLFIDLPLRESNKDLKLEDILIRG